MPQEVIDRLNELAKERKKERKRQKCQSSNFNGIQAMTMRVMNLNADGRVTCDSSESSGSGAISSTELRGQPVRNEESYTGFEVIEESVELEDEEPEEVVVPSTVDTDSESEIEDSMEPIVEALESAMSEPVVNNTEEAIASDEGLRMSLRPNRAQPGRWANVLLASVLNYYDLFVRKGRRMSDLKRTKHVLASKVTKNMTVDQAIIKLGDEAIMIAAIVKEMLMIVDEKEAFEGVKIEDLSKEELKRIKTSKMFLKEKYSADGVFEKLKARLVAGGHLKREKKLN